MFVQKFENKKKIIDLSLLPSCQTNLEPNLKEASYEAVIYRQAYRLNLVLEDARNHGTDEKRTVVWSNICYIEDISEFLFDRDEENNDQSAVTLKMRLTTILGRTLACTNNSFLAQLCI